MKKKNLFVKIVFIAVLLLLLFSLVAPAIFSQAPLPVPKKESLLNGLKILMWNDAKADKVTLQIRIHAGSAFDPQGKEGVMQMLADNIFPNEAAKEFFSDDLGGSLEITTNYDYIQVNASAKPENVLTVLETLSGAVSNPVIDQEATARLQTAQLAKIADFETNPAYIADQAAASRLFGTFPYGRPQVGSTDSVTTITFADLIDAKQRFLTADNATLAISGNFDRSLALRAIRRYFGAWLKSDKRVPSTFRQPDEPPAALLTVRSPKDASAELRFAMRGVARGDKDLASSMIFSAIVEARLKARVPAGHAEDVFVRNHFNTLPGMIIIGFSVNKPASAGEKFEANDLVAAALSTPITDAEFRAAKTLVGAHWYRKDAVSFWLDADTYKIADTNADARSVDKVTAADLDAYAARQRKMPIASVLVNTPPAGN